MLFNLSTSLFWLYLVIRITATAGAALAITQSLPLFNNETIDTALSLQYNDASNVFFTNAQNITRNETFSPPPSTLPDSNISVVPLSELIRYKVKDSNPPLAVSFHSFGPIIPDNEGIDTITETLAIVIRKVIGKGGFKPIAQGYFKHTKQFANADNVSFSVADFRELGKQMTYYTLADTLKGVGEFMKLERGGGVEGS
ncbi:hypothetical protein ABVK25_009912 [Lepraria finkii]|uniref:Uncharacterized protein n=1 Tax=Lepraria finkii TaxID=1340010 RepID=A0ABR4AY09_9LECA